ncbi:MAG: alpha-ketoglutarate-dependent dioxygenase AlkB, partial [Eudoraea sp.]|nr:alpha-ketoglutarate-dependent dioxygenase AlkB [Eudoraea sp.]
SITMHPREFTPLLEGLKADIEEIAGISFSSCLLNLYRDGRDSNGWHADDEKELGINPVIASLSLGEARSFHFKHKTNKDLRHRMTLEHGSLLLMQGTTQHHWLHQIPKTKRPIGERINLTFRVIQ